jgi:ADP-ribose pyrophosphatase YjhB (NUDIX family)
MVAERRAGRILVLDDRDRVLLFRFRDQGMAFDHWATPGGGVEPGESYEHAALRELSEELGLEGVSLGTAIWDRVSEFDLLGVWTRAAERFFLLRVRAEEVPPYDGHLADENVVGRAWWSVDELDRTNEVIWPSELASLVRSLLRDGPPSEPIPIGP